MAGVTSQTTLSGGVAVGPYSAFSSYLGITAPYVVGDADGYERVHATAAPSTFTYNSASDVSSANDTITETAHGLYTGQPIKFDTTIGGVTASVIYFVISTLDGSTYATNCSANAFAVATTLANALAGTKVGLTSTGSSTVTATPGGCVILPTASANVGRKITVKKAFSAAAMVSVMPEAAGQEIEADTTNVGCTLAFEGDTATFISNGTTWYFDGQIFHSAVVLATFTFNGSGGSVSDNLMIERRGNVATLFLDSGFRATTGTGSTAFSAPAATLPAWAYPAANFITRGLNVRNNGVSDTTTDGYIQISSAGAIDIGRDLASTAFTNSANAGVNTAYSVSWLVKNT